MIVLHTVWQYFHVFCIILLQLFNEATVYDVQTECHFRHISPNSALQIWQTQTIQKEMTKNKLNGLSVSTSNESSLYPCWVLWLRSTYWSLNTETSVQAFSFWRSITVTVSLLCPPAFVTLSCTFRYGRDDMDVMGIAFRRELYLSTRQVYPPLQDREKGVHTRTQAKLLRKLGDNAYPFFFEVRRDWKAETAD